MRTFIDILTESRGLGARHTGEEFVSTTNPDDKILVDRVEFYPSGETEYPSYADMILALEKITKGMPTALVDLIGTFKQSDRAFGVAIFARPDGGQRIVFVKPYKSIKLDPSQNNWSNQTGIPGYRYNSKAAAKTQAGMTPQDILTKQQSNLTKEDIVSQIAAKFGDDSPFTQVAQAVADGQALPIVIPAQPSMSFTAFRDYFCELLHPIALQTGQYTGNAGEAANRFLGNSGFAGCSINFGNDKTEGLSDSILINPDGLKIKVSSKGAKGATASAKNLIDAAIELENTNPALLRKHKIVIDLVRDIVKNGQTGAPLVLGVRYNIIDQDDLDSIMQFKKLPLQTFDGGLKLVSPKLAKLYRERTTNDPSSINLHFHCLAAVAHKVAEHINKSTNFSEAAGEILNNGALVQVYTKASETADTWTLQSFNTVWPSKTVTGVVLSAGKTYYSTGIKGNFTFKILLNGASNISDESNDVEAMANKVSNAADSKIADIAAGKTTTGLRPPGAEKNRKKRGISEANLGRARR